MSTLSYHFPEIAIGAVVNVPSGRGATGPLLPSICQDDGTLGVLAVHPLRSAGPARVIGTVTRRPRPYPFSQAVIAGAVEAVNDRTARGLLSGARPNLLRRPDGFTAS